MRQLPGKDHHPAEMSPVHSTHIHAIGELMVMDHVVRQKLNDIRQKQLASQEKSQHPVPSPPTRAKSHYIFALGGVAAGLTIAIAAWLAESLLTTQDVNIITPESHVTVDSGAIRETSDQIDQLNVRIRLLADSIASLETSLTGLKVLASPSNNIEMQHANTLQENAPETTGEDPKLEASGIYNHKPDTENAFVPTHTVRTRLNLRHSSSLDTMPIATLSAGTRVEYIREDNDWYYVDTIQHGKGWCFSDYLSPLSDMQ
mgnify:FL=1